jgi:trehalose 6-phosphate phosphatase
MRFRTPEGQARYDAVVAAAPRTVVGLDFDGTLSPIVPDPAAAVIHPEGPEVLGDLARAVGAVAVVTGRPVAQVLELGGLEAVADRLPDDVRLLVRGQYGNELWDSTARRISAPEAPESLARFRESLPALLAEHAAGDAFVEEKGLAVAVHTRRMADPQGAFDRLAGPLRAAAEAAGLVLEPGRLVLEVRTPGADKGEAVRALVEEYAADGLVFVGDDLGDVPAFDAVRDLRGPGLAGLLVCSGSTEQTALLERSDLVVDGPAGVLDFLRRLTRDARAMAAR